MDSSGSFLSDSVLNKLSLFQGLNPAQRALLQPLFMIRNELAGDAIFEQGDQAEYLYVVVEGEVSIRYKPVDGPALLVAHVRPEGVVGWSAALGNPAYTASAVCATDCLLLRVSSQDLRQLCEQNPKAGMILLERLATLIAERIRNTHHHVMALLVQGLRIEANKTPAAG